VAPLHPNRLPLAEPPFGVKRLGRTECPSEEEHTAGTLAAGTRELSNAIDVEGPALLASLRGVSRASWQDASSFNQQTTDASRHPLDFIASSARFGLEPCGPLPLHSEWTARWIPPRPSQSSPLIHRGTRGHDARSSSRAVSRPSTGYVVRLDPATGFPSHAWRSFAIPVSRRRSPLPRAFRCRDPESSWHRLGSRVRGRTWGAEDPLPGLFRLDSRCFLHETTSTGTPLDRTSPSTSHRTLSPNHREVILRTLRRVENETLSLIRSPSLGVARREIAPLLGGWLGLSPLPIVVPSALLDRVSPMSVKPTPPDESFGNANGWTDALCHPPAIP